MKVEKEENKMEGKNGYSNNGSVYFTQTFR